MTKKELIAQIHETAKEVKVEVVRTKKEAEGKEHVIVVNERMTVDALQQTLTELQQRKQQEETEVQVNIDPKIIQVLTATGLTEEQAKQAALALIVSAGQQVKEEQQAAAEEKQEEKKEPAKEKPSNKQENKSEKQERKPKAWFKRAVEKMKRNKKSELISQLLILKHESKDEKEKAEIEAEIKKLMSKDGDARFAKMKDFIAKTKGWTIDATGKVAELSYLSGDYTEKGAAQATKLTGKVVEKAGEFIEVTGQQVKKGGQFITKHSEDVGKAARIPFDLIGDAINVLNGTKKKRN
jgi:hypothetical protein